MISKQGPLKIALMAKQRMPVFDKDRHIKRLTNEHECTACKESGHWKKDHLGCENIIRQKRLNVRGVLHDDCSSKKEASGRSFFFRS